MKFALILLAAAAPAQTLVPVEPGLAEVAGARRFLQAAISPDGSHVAYLEALSGPGNSEIYVAPRILVSAAVGKTACDENSISWSPDGEQLAFLSDCGKKDQLQLYVAAIGGSVRQLTHVRGLLADPRWSPDGRRIGFLFTENLPHSAGTFSWRLRRAAQSEI
jgi:Tol biopolymer transport system component